jgi:hypothetical protein
MNGNSSDETLLVRYLLGDLPDQDQMRVEARAFADREYLRLIEAVEADLVDAYVRGALSRPERRLFENRFLAAAERREKIEFARALAHLAADSNATAVVSSPAAVVPQPAWRELLAASVRSWTPTLRYAFALAAVAAVVAAVAWQTIATTRLRDRVTQLEAEQRNQQNREHALRRTADEERKRAENLAAELQRDRGQRAASLPPIVSLVLMPGVSRGENAPARLLLPASAQLARIEIPLETKDVYPRFRVELRTRSGEEILTRNNLRAERGAAVVLDVPASVLTTTDYELTLQGVADQRPVDLGYYAFTVRKQ